MVESALRGRIARSYEALAGLPAAIVGKLDAAIPHILIAEGVGGAWNITEDVRDAVDLLAGFARSGQKDASTYLHQMDMMSGKAPIEVASRKALAIFHAALDKKKGEFAAAFTRYASDAKISPEAGGLPGLVKGPGESLAGAVGGEAKAETAKEEQQVEGTPEKKATAKPAAENKARETDKGVALASLRTSDKNPDVVGRINEEVAKHLPTGKAGAIRLDAAAATHIEEEHGEQIHKAGFKDARGFVQHVMDNADAVYEGNTKRTLFLVAREQGKPWNSVVVRLEFDPKGDFYKVKTAHPMSTERFQKKKLLWDGAHIHQTPKGSSRRTAAHAYSQSSLSDKEDSGSEGKVKAASGMHLSPKHPGKGLQVTAVKRVTDAFGRRAKNAAPVQVVQSFGDLPATIREAFSGNESDLEAAYETQSGTVWFVADNLTDPGRVTEVWMHEQVVHHGLRSMLSESERKKMLSQLWFSLGGMSNARIKETASSRGLNPSSNESERMTVMEEVIASMAEKRRLGDMTEQDARLWKKIVNAILRAWKTTVQAVSGRDARMAYENIDGLLAALGRHVMDGERGNAESLAQTRTDGVQFPKVHKLPAGLSDEKDIPAGGAEVKSAASLEQEAWDRLQEEAAEWNQALDEGMILEKPERFKALRVCSTPDVLRKLGAKSQDVQIMHPRLLKIRDKHNIPLELLRDLPKQISDPLMVFKSDTMANSYVVLTELEHNGENLVAAIHFDVREGRATVNDIASIHDRSTTRDDGTTVPGLMWFRNQIRKGNLRYYDKNRSPRWFRDRAGLQLPGEMNRESYRGIKVLTDKDIVKPVDHRAGNDAAPLASLGGTVQKVLEKAGQKQNAKRDLSGISKKEIADNPALAEALSKIGTSKPTLAEKLADAKANWKRTMEQGLFDRFASIRDYSETGYKMARMTTGIGSQLNSLMVSGAPIWRENAAAADGKSLYEVFDPVSGEVDRFLRWMVGRRASRLKTEGRENLFTKEDIASLAELSQGKTADGKDRAKVYAEVFNDLAEFKKKVLDFAQEGGIIDPEARKVWENADYIPFYRVQERLDGAAATGGKNKKGITGQDAGIKELKGGLENLGDPLENLLQNFTHLIDAAQKNRTAIQVFQDMHKAGMAERLTTERTQARLKEDSIELAEALEADNLLSGLSDEQKKSLLSVFAVKRDVDSSRSKDGGVVYARWQGRPYLFKVSDPLLYRALTGMNDKNDGGMLMKTGRKFKRLLTAGVTSMPDFIVRNFLRDTVHAWVVEHKSGVKPLTGSLRGLKKTLQMDETTRQLYASGATFMGAGFRLGHDPEAARLTLERVLAKSRINKEGFFKTVLDDPKKLSEFATLAWEKYEELSGAGENAVRHQIYEKMREKGYSHLDSSFAAKDVMDFSMRGEFAFIRTLTELVPFMGARITGLQRMGKGAMEDPRAFAFKGGMVAMASVGLYMINQMFNKADWDDLEDWDKDTYYHFWIGGKHFRLPKPFEVGFVFGTIPERMTEQAMTDAPARVFWGRVFHGLADQLAMDPTPQAVKPIVEQIANRDLFRDKPIVGMALEKRLPVKQYTARTSMTARMFADAMDALLTPVIGKTGADALRSPVRLEHLVNGYFGGMGSTVLGMSDHVMRWLRDEPAMPDGRGPEDWPVIRAFYRGDSSSPQRTRLERELYDSIREADSLYSSLKMLRDTGDVEGEKALRKSAGKKGELLLKQRQVFNRLRKQLSGFNRQIDAVYHDRVLSGSQKRAKIDGIQARKNALAKAEWEKVRQKMKRLQ